MGSPRQQVSSFPLPPLDHVLGCDAGGGDDDDDDDDGSGTIASAPKTEILTGSDALHFLCSNSGIENRAFSTRNFSFSKLLSKMSATTPASPQPTMSLASSSRTQRKGCRPSRVPPLNEVQPLPHIRESSVIPDNLVSLKTHYYRKRKQDLISGGASDVKGADHGTSSIVKGEKRKLQSSPHIDQNASAICKNLARKAVKDIDRGTLLVVKGEKRKLQSSPHTHQNSSVICKNLACKAVLHVGASFCRRCSCCLCKEFDDNKDPSLWITCDVEEEGCGLSCHLECALQNGVAGVITESGSVFLDGSFNCKSCGKISSLIGLWRRQLLIAKGARRVDVLYHRLSLSHKLLKGTLKYRDAHAHLNKAVKILEAEVGLMNKGSSKLERCIVNRLSCNTEVQEMIDLALERADSLGDAQSAVLDAHDAGTRENVSFCTMQFEDICSSSIVVVAVDNHPSEGILGYKLWHRKASDLSYPVMPSYTISNTSKKVLVSDLQSCTSYVFKMAPFSSHGDQEECEAECSTEGMDSTLVENHEDDIILHCTVRDKNTYHGGASAIKDPQCHSSSKPQCVQNRRADRHGRHMDDLSSDKALLIAEVAEGEGDCFMNPSDAQAGHPIAIQKLTSSQMDVFCNGVISSGDLEKKREEPFAFRDALDSRPYSWEKAVNVDVIDDNNVSSINWAMQVHCYDAQMNILAKEAANNERRDFLQGKSDADFCTSEFVIRVVRWLECQGHLDHEFRMKFLTWYSLRATEHEKRVVNIFMDTLQDSPASLAAQLVDAFQEIINSKRHRVTELGYYSRPYQ